MGQLGRIFENDKASFMSAKDLTPVKQFHTWLHIWLTTPGLIHKVTSDILLTLQAKTDHGCISRSMGTIEKSLTDMSGCSGLWEKLSSEADSLFNIFLLFSIYKILVNTTLHPEEKI